jgi:MFS family permease
VARNIETLLISRFIDGAAGSSFLSVAGGSVGDMFEKATLHTPMMVFTASPLLGPSLGPLLGGFICQYTTWHASSPSPEESLH